MHRVILLFSAILWFGIGWSQTIAEVLMPQFIQGSDQSGNPRRLPFACRLSLSELKPNATYRYITRAIIPTNGASNDGAGNSIYVGPTGNFVRTSNASLSQEGGFGTFTTDDQGSYTGWFILEPTGNVRFATGGVIRIRLLLNNGEGGTSIATRLTAPSEVKVIDFSTATNDQGAGSGIRSTPAAGGVPMNFVMLYDNTEGNNRPIAGTFIESDGTSGSSLVNWYYNEEGGGLVDGIDGAWGAIIPNDLPTGIRRIAQLDRLTGNIVGFNVSNDGTWPSLENTTISTVNPSNGIVPLAVNGTEVPLPLGLIQFMAHRGAQQKVMLSWTLASGHSIENVLIEQSLDGSKFVEVGQVVTSFGQLRYQHTLVAPTPTHFYRLKLKYRHQHSAYSEIIKIDAVDEHMTVNVWPNPARGICQVKHPTLQNGVITLLDLSGKPIRSWQVPAGAVLSAISLEGVAKGMYFIQIRGNGVSQAHKILKE